MSTDRPYTDDDIRAEAARQLAAAAEGDYTDDLAWDEDDDIDRVGQRMANETIRSRATWSSRAWWHSLRDEPDGDDHFKQAQRAIYDLIDGAADLSAWAVALGADNLQPDTRRFAIGWTGTAPAAVLPLAFAADMPQQERDELIAAITAALAPVAPVRLER